MATRTVVIEDNPANLQLMTYLLKAFGHTVVSAVDGEKGLETARHENPELIICDVHLPGIDGYEVARRLKRDLTTQSIPVVAVTALAMVGDRDKVLAAGFDGYISKPINPETFVREVETFLHRAGQLPAEPVSASTFVATDTPKHPKRQGTILVIDNHSVNLALAQSTLAPVGYNVMVAQGVQEGLEMARQIHPDLILSDVHLAGESGFDLLRAIRADPGLKSIVFIFITSTARQEVDMANGLASGAADFITRPISPEALLGRIELCLQQRENHDGIHTDC